MIDLAIFADLYEAWQAGMANSPRVRAATFMIGGLLWFAFLYGLARLSYKIQVRLGLLPDPDRETTPTDMETREDVPENYNPPR